jgi:hypothetical protein
MKVPAGYFFVLSAHPLLLCCTGARMRSWVNDLFTREIVFGEFSLLLKVLGVLTRSRKTAYNVQQAIRSACGQALIVSDVLQFLLLYIIIYK